MTNVTPKRPNPYLRRCGGRGRSGGGAYPDFVRRALARASSWGETDEKEAQRRSVLAYLLAHDAGGLDGKGTKLFSTPSVRWLFEHKFLAARPRARVVGVEREPDLWAASSRFAPGRRRPKAADVRYGDAPWSLCGNADVTRRPVRVLYNDRVSLFHTDCLSLLTAAASHHPHHRCPIRAAGGWHPRQRWTSVWLDLVCPAGCYRLRQTLLLLARLNDDDYHNDVPVAVTVMKGRDKRRYWDSIKDGFNGDRAGYMASVLNRASPGFYYVLDDVVEHRSAGRHPPFTTVLGRLIPTEEHPSHFRDYFDVPHSHDYEYEYAYEQETADAEETVPAH